MVFGLGRPAWALARQAARAVRGELGCIVWPGQTSRASLARACERPRWGNVGEGLQEVAVTEEVGRRSRIVRSGSLHYEARNAKSVWV